MNWGSKLLLAATTAVAIAAGAMWLGKTSGPTAAQGPPNVVDFDSGCVLQGRGPQDMFFFFGSDTPWDAAWIDVSLHNNGFAPGTFFSAGPFSAEYRADALPDRRYNNYYVWTDLKPGVTHYFRVNLLYGSRWHPSPTQTFYVPFVCQGATTPPLSPPSAVTTDDLERRLDTLEDCLDIGALFPGAPGLFKSCGNIEDLYNRLNDLEWRLNDLEGRLTDLEWDSSWP